MVTRLGRSRPRVGTVGYTGPIPPGIYGVLERAHSGCIYLRSDHARSDAHLIALAASLGWITNIHINGTEFLPFWVITQEGLHAYTIKDDP
jgi:hypothetical protein